jgi:hypothetical protein
MPFSLSCRTQRPDHTFRRAYVGTFGRVNLGFLKEYTLRRWRGVRLFPDIQLMEEAVVRHGPKTCIASITAMYAKSQLRVF